MPLKVLDPKVIAGISAGEVIERPASVVKELVENSLDAGATRIVVEIERGGVGSLRVTDNGSGIPAADAVTAFSRHATSKLSSLEDLSRIASFGFRGEALAAIAAAADVEMLTREGRQSEGVMVKGQAGRKLEARPAGCEAGTSVLARDLFRRIPARLKFLKSPGAESSAIARTLEFYGLSRPSVHFILRADGEERLNYPPVSDSHARVREVLGAAGADLAPIEGGAGPLRVSGFAQSPGTVRRRGRLWLLVNGRPVDDRALRHALLSAYRGRMAADASPNAVIYLEVPPERMDVNVHPAKAEVRFLDQQAVYRLLLDALRGSFGNFQAAPNASSVHAQWGRNGAREGGGDASAGFLMGEDASRGGSLSDEAQVWRPAIVADVPDLRVLGQLFGTYIVAQDRLGLFIVDQHAAHEKIIFERLRRRERERSAQVLLIPQAVELRPAEAMLLAEHGEALKELGFEADGFGGRTVVFRAVPEESADLEGLVRRVLAELAEVGRAPDREETRRRLRASVACHMAVQAGKNLGEGEMEALLRELLALEDNRTCPHGRPTILRFSEADLARRFQRT